MLNKQNKNLASLFLLFNKIFVNFIRFILCNTTSCSSSCSLIYFIFYHKFLSFFVKKKIKVYTPMPFWNKYPFYLQLVFIIITNNRMDLINHSFLSFINLAELLSMKGCCRLSLHCWSKTTNDWLALSPQGDKTCIFIGRNVLNNQKTRNMKRK